MSIAYNYYRSRLRVRDGLELQTADILPTKTEAERHVSPWRNLRGFKTSVRRRSVKADGLELVAWVAVVWKKGGAS